MARERWDKRSAFILAAIGSAIGLGNVWRFPYMAYSNGGGAFFIPYIIALITTGFPLVALEYYLGIRYQKGPTEVFNKLKINTNFIGWFALGISFMIAVYYTVIMGWTWNFLAHSFKMSWSGREKDFFFSDILQLSKGVWQLDGINWPVLIGNGLTWIAIYLIIFKGVKVVGKIVTWTVGLPWLLLLVLIIRGVTLEGATHGIMYYLTPNFQYLSDPNVWLAAYGQIFFSLTLGFGVMIAYASYLPKESDIHANAWVVSFANCGTSFFAGFAVFSILGYLAVSNNQPIQEVVKAGPGLAFVVYPAAIAKLPGGLISQAIFGISFFLMLLMLGIDSAFSLVEAVVTGLKDSFNFAREKVTLIVCIIGFLLGTIYCTKAGLYWLDIVDHWMNWGLVIVGLLEAILIGWFLDIEKIAEDIDSTSQIKLGKIWVFSIKYLTPIILFLTIVTSIYKEFKTPYEGYSIWALLIGGWLMLMLLFSLANVLQHRDNLKEKLLKIFIWDSVLLVIFVGSYFLYKYSNQIFSKSSEAAKSIEFIPSLTGSITSGVIIFFILFGGTFWGLNRMKQR